MHNEKQNIEKEIEEISPLVKGMLQKAGMQVPENYFTELEAAILESTIHNQGKSKIVILRKWYVYAASVAAVFAVLFFGTTLFQKKQIAPLPFEEQIAALSTEDIRAMIEDHITEFDTQLLVETNFVNTERLNAGIHEDLQKQVISENKKEPPVSSEEIELDKSILQQLDDSSIRGLLMDELLINDLGL